MLLRERWRRQVLAFWAGGEVAQVRDQASVSALPVNCAIRPDKLAGTGASAAGARRDRKTSET
jgi:hypothetical protein